MRIIKGLFAGTVVILLSGCAASIAYRADYVPDRPISETDRIAGRVLIYTTRGDDERLITSGATSITGSGLKITIPVGTMTREIAVKVFSKVAADGASASNDLADAGRYAVVLRPETKDLTHGFPQIQNLGFAITPEVHLTMRMSILDATGKPLLEKEYDSGVVSGRSYMVSGSPSERINHLAHETMYDLMRRAADDVHIYQNSSAPGGTSAPAVIQVPATVTTEAKLQELKRLHDQGLISDDIYAQRQKAILDQQ
jgi:hypothetical protein